MARQIPIGYQHLVERYDGRGFEARSDQTCLLIYFFEGKYDYTVNYPLAKDYFEKLNAPVKGFYTFENFAHSPMFEDPEKMIKILLENVLTGKNDLVDGK